MAPKAAACRTASGNAQDYSVNPQDAAFFTLDGVVTLCNAGLNSFTAPFNLSAPGPHLLQVPCVACTGIMCHDLCQMGEVQSLTVIVAVGLPLPR